MPDEPEPPTRPMQGGLNPEELLAHGLQSTHRTAWTPPSVEQLQRALPQYDILALAGRGGMGAVFKARHKRLDRAVAIKVLPADIEHDGAAFAERFEREAKAMARLSHPNIVAVHDAGEADGLLYFVMDFIEGTDVQKLVQQRGRLPPAEALSIAARVCDALAYAHGKGIVHRDIKPSNVMIDPEGNVKVADFGLARLTTADFTLTASDLVMGTPAYMAPEQHKGMAVDQRADIYSLGVMLYEMFCGELPHGVFTAPSTRIGCDPRIDTIANKAMQSEPERRYQSTTEMKAAVDEVHEGTRPPGAFSPEANRSAEKRRTASGQENETHPEVAFHRGVFATLAVLVLIGGGAWFYFGKKPASAAHTSAGIVAVLPPRPASGSADATPPAPIRLWNSPASVAGNKNVRWEDNAVRVDAGAPKFPAIGKDCIFRAAVWMNPEAKSQALFVRWAGTAGQEDGYSVGITQVSRVILLQKVVRGQYAELERWSLPRAYGPEEWVRLELRAVGDELTASFDGRVLGTVRDSTHTQPGTVRIYAAAAGYFRDIEYVPLDQPGREAAPSAPGRDVKQPAAPKAK